MTSNTSYVDPRANLTRDGMGPLTIAMGQTAIIAIVLVIFGAVPNTPSARIFVSIMGIAAACMAGRSALTRIPVSLSMLALICWTVASASWSHTESWTIFALRNEIPPTIVLVLLCGLLPIENTKQALVLAFRAGLLITIIVLLVDPATRLREAGDARIALAGWRGWFGHKNGLGAFAVLALATFLALDRRSMLRTVGIAVVAVLIIGSRSATGLTVGVAVTALYMWMAWLDTTRGRWTTGFVATSLAFGAAAAVVMLFSLPTVVGAYGKDLTLSGRTAVWDVVIDRIVEQPLLGYGYDGVFTQPPSPMARDISAHSGFDVPHAHQGAIDLTLQLGLIGLALFVVFFARQLGVALRLLDHRFDEGRFVMMVLAAQFLTSLSESTFLDPWLAFTAAVHVMAILALRERRRTLIDDRDLAR